MPSKEYEDILEVLNSLPDTTGLPFEEGRLNFEAQASQLPVADNVSCEPFTIDNIPAEWIVPEEALEKGVLLYLHGGGYCIGPINTHRGMVSHISSAAGIKSLIETQKDYWWGLDRALRLRCTGKIIIVGVGKGRVFEANNLGKRAIPVYSSSEIFSEIQDAESTAGFYYLLGRTKDEVQISLYRFSADTHSAFELIDGSEYELYAFTVVDDDTVVFKAVRRSDGASIGGTIDLAGEITIIEAIQDRDIVQLERVL